MVELKVNLNATPELETIQFDAEQASGGILTGHILDKSRSRDPIPFAIKLSSSGPIDCMQPWIMRDASILGSGKSFMVRGFKANGTNGAMYKIDVDDFVEQTSGSQAELGLLIYSCQDSDGERLAKYYDNMGLNKPTKAPLSEDEDYQAVIDRVINKKSDDIQKAYESELQYLTKLKQKKVPEGKLEVRFVIEPDGQTSAVEVLSLTSKCTITPLLLKMVFQYMEFPDTPNGQPVVVTYPITYSAEEKWSDAS